MLCDCTAPLSPIHRLILSLHVQTVIDVGQWQGGSVCASVCMCVLIRAYNLDDSIWKLDRRHGSEELLHLFAFLKIAPQTTCWPDCSPLQIDWCNTILLNMFIFIQIHSMCIKYTQTRYSFHSSAGVSAGNTQSERARLVFTFLVYRWICWDAECCRAIYFIEASTFKLSFIQK